jgi:chromosome segregation ATPase
VADVRTLAFLEELERADSAVAATLAELDSLADAVEATRTRAVELEAFLVRLPAERERLAAECDAAAARLEAVRSELAVAESELSAAEAEDGARQEGLRHAVVRHRDALGMAERRAAEVRTESQAMEVEAEAAQGELPQLVERAESLADELRERPRLAETAGVVSRRDLVGVAEWAAGARAALFVARGSLASERDALIRQASELGAVVLGERVFGGSAAEVARRVRRAG